MTEFLTEGFQKAVGWSILLGLPTPGLGYVPITEVNGMIETKSYERFSHIVRGLAYFSIYSRQNKQGREESYGIQVMGPYKKRSLEVGSEADNNVAIQWQKFGDSGREIVVVELEKRKKPSPRHLSLYYENGARILEVDSETAKQIELVVMFHDPIELARLILQDQIDTDDFASMLSKLTGV